MPTIRVRAKRRGNEPVSGFHGAHGEAGHPKYPGDIFEIDDTPVDDKEKVFRDSKGNEMALTEKEVRQLHIARGAIKTHRAPSDPLHKKELDAYLKYREYSPEWMEILKPGETDIDASAPKVDDTLLKLKEDKAIALVNKTKNEDQLEKWLAAEEGADTPRDKVLKVLNLQIQTVQQSQGSAS